MRCEDCLPLIEEYFDGEVEETAAARMGAHLSSCATCAAALDALSFEQEIYARYDRKLEVTPDLWARVSAEIARDPRPAASPDPRRPFLSRVREGLAAALGALSVRPALASSLALLVVGLTAGSLWLARRPQTIAPAEVASNAPPTRAAEAPTAPAAGAVVPALRNGSLNVTESANAAEPEAKRGAEAAAREAATRVAPRREAAAGTVTIAPGFVVAE
ncbi:MAG TPA: zf-HC2 domain-containing protein, partial [Pyrinomonadaceae bacterium]